MDKYFSINEQGCSIRCKLYCEKQENIKRAVVFGHGFGGHKDNKAAERFAKRVQKKNSDIAVVTFNWPCHGDDSLSRLTLEACDLYLGLVLSHLKERYGAEQIQGYATSFGGYLFLKYIHDHGNPFGAVALRSPAVHMYEDLTGAIMDRKQTAAIAKGKPVQVGFDRKVRITREFLEELKEADITAYDFSADAEQLLILHGTKDEIVSFDQSQEFAQKNGIAFEAFAGADHRFQDPKLMDLAIDRIVRFFGFR